MQFKLTRMAIAVAMAGFIGACGGGDGAGAGAGAASGSGGEQTSTEPTAPSIQQIKFSGHVADQNNVNLPGVAVRLENQTTKKSINTVTASNGSFSINAEQGMYNIFLVDEGPTYYIEREYVNLNLQVDENREFKMEGTRDLPLN